MIKKINLLLLVICLQYPCFSQLITKEVKRIVFLGNSITWAGNYIVYFEAYLRARYPERPLEIINLGLPSETVSGLSEPGHAGGDFPRPDLHERLLRVLKQTKPDLVVACYGMNDGIYMPLSKERFKNFKDGITWLHNEVVKSGATIVHLTPPDYDELRGKSVGYAAVLDHYSDWILSRKNALKWDVVDIHYPMKTYLAAHRKVDAKFRIHGFALAQDGVHPGEVGHWIIARQLLLYLGFKEVADEPGLVESLQKRKNAPEYVRLLTERHGLIRDAWLSATKHKRPGLPVGLPLNEAQRKAEELLVKITALSKGSGPLLNATDASRNR